MDVLLQEALVACQQQSFQVAIDICQVIIKQHPQIADAYHLMGIAYCQIQLNQKGCGCIQKAITLNSGNADYYFNLGNALKQSDQWDGAIQAYQNAIRINPGHAQCWYNLGIVYTENYQIDEAIAAYQRATQINPVYIKAYLNLANVYLDMNQSQAASAIFKRLLKIQSDSDKAWLGLGLAAKQQDQFETALHYFKKGLSCNQSNEKLHYNLANTYRELKCFNKAIRQYQKALQYQPDYALARYALASTHLLLGQFQQGLPDYEFRWRHQKNPRRYPEKSQWRGQNLSGKRLLVWDEQGIGDTLQFSRMLPELFCDATQCTLVCDRRLIPLFKRNFNTIEMVDHTSSLALGDYDFHVPIGSLWLPFYQKYQCIPALKELQAEVTRVVYFKQKYQHLPHLKIGISWRSGNPDVGQSRSIALNQWHALLGQPKVHFFDLQYGDTQAERQKIKHTGIDLIHDNEVDPLIDLENFLALLKTMDLIISIDNSTVHFAASMNVSVWTLLPEIPDWRWQMDTSGSQWYPSMKLYRQQTRNNWADVFEQVSRDLRLIK